MARNKSEKCSDVIQILGGANHDTVREDEDFYATPTIAVQKLIDAFGSVLTQSEYGKWSCFAFTLPKASGRNIPGRNNVNGDKQR